MPASHHRVRNSACFEKPNLTQQTDTCNAISKYVNIHKYVEKMQRTSINNCGLLFHSILGRNCKLVSRWALQVPSSMVPQGNIVHTVSLAVSLTVSLKVSFTRSLSRFLSRFWTFVKLFDVPFFVIIEWIVYIYTYMCVCVYLAYTCTWMGAWSKHCTRPFMVYDFCIYWMTPAFVFGVWFLKASHPCVRPAKKQDPIEFLYL